MLGCSILSGLMDEKESPTLLMGQLTKVPRPYTQLFAGITRDDLRARSPLNLATFAEYVI